MEISVFQQKSKIPMVSIIGNIEFEQNFKMTIISLFENFRIRPKFQNDHDILDDFYKFLKIDEK